MAPDDLIREIPLIERYSRHNEAEDFRFRDFLKFRLNLSNAALDAIVHETTQEVWSKIDCLACANCCKTLHIVVDEADIRRLARRLAVTPQEFRARYVKMDTDKTLLFKSQPCPLLGPDNRCAVYEDRPQACRDFPYLHDKDFRSRTLSMIDNTTRCPIVFNVWRELKRKFKFGKQSRKTQRG